MNEIFLIFLSLSFSGSLIALLLLLLKPIIKNRLSKTWQYYIFVIVIIRLLLPFGPETSLMRMVFHQAESYVDTEHNPDQIFEMVTVQLPSGEKLLMQPDGNTGTPKSLVRYIGQMVITWLWLVWLIPATLLLIRKVFGYHCFIRSAKRGCHKIECPHTLDIYRNTCEKMGVRHLPGIAKNEQLAAPMLIGAIRPVIVLSYTDIKDAEMQYIFQHELIHYRRLDIVYKWLVQIAVCVHWYNPLVYWISREVNRNCELSCDEVVIRQLNEEDQHAYGDMLLETIRLDKLTSSQVVSTTLNEDTKLIKERLGAIMKYRKKSPVIVFISALLAIFLFCSATFAGAYRGTKPVLPAPDQQLSNTAIPAKTNKANVQMVVFDQVEMRRYEGEDGHPYIHDIKTNHTTKEIVSCQHGMLAFDKEGNPLKIDWWCLDTELDETFYNLYSMDTTVIPPGETDNVRGGWSLNYYGIDPEVDKIAYVLYCDKEITFEDGTTWENPDFKNWLTTYEGKQIDVNILESYYPFEQTIVF